MKQYFLIGEHLPHTASAFIHSRLMELKGVSGQYGILEIAEGCMEEKISLLKSADGFNVTIPYKREIIAYLSGLDERAKLYGSVNTVKCEDGRMYGYNTDCSGFLSALKLMGSGLKGRVIILGNGGVASMAACEALIAGTQLTIAGRNINSCIQLKDTLSEKFPGADIDAVSLDAAEGEFDLLINCTPVGMYPNVGKSPVGEDVVSRCGAVYDMIYNPEETELLKTAKRLGKRCCTGMSMLVIQAAHAQTIWNGVDFSDEEILSVISSASEFVKENF